MTFNGPLGTYTPFGLLSTRTPIIAPFFADVDTRPSGSGLTRYGYGQTSFEGHDAFCVNWVDVGYYNGHTDKLNTFQLLLVSRPEKGGGAFDIVFNYGKVQWETGDASGGSGGMGGTPARAGFSSGRGVQGTSMEMPGSGISGAFLDSSPTALIGSNLGSSIPGRYVFAARGDGVIADKYVALGDSFQSGEGAWAYEAGTDTDTNTCHRSADAYPNLLVNRQSVRLDLIFRACSGAVMYNLVSGGQNDGPAQIDASGYDSRLVTVGIVGNDLDFSGTLSACVKTSGWNVLSPWISLAVSCEKGQGDDVAAKIDSLKRGQIHADLLSLYRMIRAKAPYARIVVVNYPKFFEKNGQGTIYGCTAIRNSDERWMNDAVTQADASIEAIASMAGFEYVDMADVLAGHEQCTDQPGLNAILWTGLPQVVKNESFHPNVLGHSLMADRIQTHLGTAVDPTFVIQPEQLVTRTFTVVGKSFSVNTGWPGSDVETALISPSGRQYTRANHDGAEHGNSQTYEYYRVLNPEPGEWTVTTYGLDVATEGEPVTLSTFDEIPVNLSPTAAVQVAHAGHAYTFDASASTDPDGSIVSYEWQFGDGAKATGPIVTHTFTTPGSYDVTLITTDNDGAEGFGYSPQTIEVPKPSAAAVYSATSLTLTNDFTLDGADANVVVTGDFSCNSNTHVHGDVTASGNAYLTNKCRIDGNLDVGGTVTMDSTPLIAGDVDAVGAVRFQSSAKVTGNIRTASTFTSTDGATQAALKTSGAVGGTITTQAAVDPPPTRLNHRPRQGMPPVAARSPHGRAGCTPQHWSTRRRCGRRHCPPTLGARWHRGDPA